ncbi:MAG: hypothetical protein COS35_06485 [Zetaproteobacteria bacterium CG02_land_8_20_14_3_00_50_9]|nr:MAG: hypothetical protein COS35_06485 [Zetaproteobacteria bacterium CG02_land_8_20_14_3_00_50_9]
MGAPAEVIEQYQAQKASEETFAIWPENARALELFLALGTQWRTSLVPVQGGFFRHVDGLDYQAAEAVMRIDCDRNRKDLFSRLRIMESAALEELNS